MWNETAPGYHARRQCTVIAWRMRSGESPVHSWNARKKELGSSYPSKNEISLQGSCVLVR